MAPAFDHGVDGIHATRSAYRRMAFSGYPRLSLVFELSGTLRSMGMNFEIDSAQLTIDDFLANMPLLGASEACPRSDMRIVVSIPDTTYSAHLGRDSKRLPRS